jgi:hypothetical protein
MYGRFATTLSYDPPGSNNLVVTGPLVAQSNADLATAVKIKAEIWQDPNRKVECSTNGGGICPLYDPPGATWKMEASTTLKGPVNGHARAFDHNNNVVAEWFQPALPNDPKIVIQ